MEALEVLKAVHERVGLEEMMRRTDESDLETWREARRLRLRAGHAAE